MPPVTFAPRNSSLDSSPSGTANGLRVYEATRPNGALLVLATTIVGRDTLGAIASEIEAFEPEVLILDYDTSRWRWLTDPEFREEADLVQIIKRGELATLNARLAHAILRKYVSPLAAGVTEQDEIVTIVEAARARGCDVHFAHRDVSTEGVRGWRKCGLGGRARIAWTLVLGSFKRSRYHEEDLTSARQAFDVEEVRTQITSRLPDEACRVLVDEAEQWLAARVWKPQGRVVLVTREFHRRGIERALAEPPPDDEQLQHVPAKSLFARAFPWAFSAAIIASFILGFAFGDWEKMQQAVYAWFGANMILAALGAIAARAHPWAVIATSVSAPFVSLNPAVGAGMVGALVQAIVAPPTLRDMDFVGDDIAHWRGWWQNRLARILLVFVFANVASTIGSFVALAWF